MTIVRANVHRHLWFGHQDIESYSVIQFVVLGVLASCIVLICYRHFGGPRCLPEDRGITTQISNLHQHENHKSKRISWTYEL